MRILLVSGSAPPMRCGVGDYSAALAQALAARADTRVALLTSRGAHAPEPRQEGDLQVFASMRDWSARDIGAARAVLRMWKPDVVHLQYPTLGYASAVLPSLFPLLAWSAGALPVRTWHEAFSGRQSARFLLQSAAPGPYVAVRPNFSDLLWPPLRFALGFRRKAIIAGASSIPRSTIGEGAKAALRASCLGRQSRLLVFFGFLYPAKGVEQLFEIADPARDALVIAGNPDVDPAYTEQLRALCGSARWAGRARVAGFMPVDEVADLLAAADAVVLPFVQGGGNWNSSISAALVQGTPVVTTATERHGLDAGRRIYFARPNDMQDLRRGLEAVLANRVQPGDIAAEEDDWSRIAEEHMALYRSALNDSGWRGHS